MTSINNHKINHGRGGRYMIDAIDEDTPVLGSSKTPVTNTPLLPLTNSQAQAVSVPTRRQELWAKLTTGWDAASGKCNIAKSLISPHFHGVWASLQGGWATAIEWIRPRASKAWTKLKKFVGEVLYHTLVVTCSKYLDKLCVLIFETIKQALWG